jgi:NAD(P)-dependent dehydrogenase (short-subunit alcohol dehydrogenase family)
VKALVTGGARGIGEAVAGRLVADGADVALIDLAEEVVTTAERLAAPPGAGRVLGRAGSVTDEAFVDDAVAWAADALGGLDVVVSAAGVGGPSDPVLEVSVESFRQVLDVNVVGTFLVSRAAARRMRGDGGGCIVTVGSMIGRQAVANAAAYCASKGAVAILTQALAIELAPHAIRVNSVAPGHTATEMHWEAIREGAAARGVTYEEELEAVRSTIPLGRHGTGEDIAGAVAWLASPDAAYVTGQTIAVNGGAVLGT